MGQHETLGNKSTEKLVKELFQQLAYEAYEVRVGIEEAKGTMMVQVRVASSDFDRVVGRNGTTAQSLAVIVGAVAKKLGKHCTVQIRKSDTSI